MDKLSKIFKACFLAFTTIYLAACAQVETPVDPTVEILVPSPTSTLLIETPIQEQLIPELTPTPMVSNDPVLSDYELLVVFDYLNQTAQISQQITYTNNSEIPLTSLVLACDTLRYPGAFSLEKITINGNEQSDSQIEKYYIEIALDDDLTPDQTLIIQIDYQLQVPPLPPPADDRKPGIFGYSTVQTNFVDWYPFIPPLTEDGEWLLHEPWFYGEYLVYDLANFYVDIELNNAPSGTRIAASTLPLESQEDFYRFRSSSARNFVWSLSPSYVIESKVVNGVTITTHTFPFHQAAGLHVLEESSKAIELYSRLFSPYPRENLTIVEADFLDGMEYDGLFFLSRGFYNLFDNSPQNYLTTIAVHETAHQWWYSSIANDQALEPWLDEALCTYSELLFYEEYYPELVDWWWEYRVNYYLPEGLIDRPIYDYQGFVPYRNATYLRGALFLQSLREELGDDIFFRFINAYAQNQKNQISSQEDFFIILREFSEKDLQSMSEYFLANP